jgi:hypothetical protein
LAIHPRYVHRLNLAMASIACPGRAGSPHITQSLGELMKTQSSICTFLFCSNRSSPRRYPMLTHHL